jgi:hypothetical protein
MSKGNAVFVEWGNDAAAVSVTSLEELDSLLDDLECMGRSTAPFLVVLVGADGSSLTIGVGRDESIAQYSDGTDDGPSFAGVAANDTTNSAQTCAPLVFELDGEPNEMLAELATPSESTRQAARYFFTERGRDPRMRWEPS